MWRAVRASACAAAAVLLLGALGCASQPGDGSGNDSATGAVEGWLYSRHAGTASATGNNFILASAQDASLPTPVGRTVVSLSQGLRADVEQNGHYRISLVPPGVYSLTVREELPGGGTYSDLFAGVVVVPGTTTYGAEAPSGYEVRIVPPARTTIGGGDQIALAATLVRTSDGREIKPFGPFEWASSNPSIVMVTPAGLATGLGQGSATVTASAGPLRDELVLTVSGGEEPPSTVAIGVSLETEPAGDTTVVSGFSLSVPQGEVKVPESALVQVQAPDTGQTPHADKPATTPRSVGLGAPVAVRGTGTLVITISAATPMEFSDGAVARCKVTRFMLRCGVTSAGQTLFPDRVTMVLPGEGARAAEGGAALAGVSEEAAPSLTLYTAGGTYTSEEDAEGNLAIVAPPNVTVTTLDTVALEFAAR